MYELGIAWAIKTTHGDHERSVKDDGCVMVEVLRWQDGEIE